MFLTMHLYTACHTGVSGLLDIKKVTVLLKTKGRGTKLTFSLLHLTCVQYARLYCCDLVICVSLTIKHPNFTHARTMGSEIGY